MHQPKVCAVCHAHFTAHRLSQITCCNRCYMRNQHHPGEPDRPRACDVCSKPFPVGTNRARKHCPSRDCQQEALNVARRLRLGRRALGEYRSCGHCGIGIDPPKKGKQFCSDRCWSRESRFPGSWPHFRDRRCERCNEPLSIAMKREARFCNKICQNRANGMTRRARQVGTAVENFSRFDVFERDGWVCHICHELVERALQWPHPRAASLDHVIPLNELDSPGHVFANTACAHLFCNHSKNARTRYEDRSLFVALDATGKPPLVGALF